MTSSTNPALSQWSLDREIVMSRVIDAPRDLVFEAWSDPKHLPQWFGPKDFKVETFEIDVRVGQGLHHLAAAAHGRNAIAILGKKLGQQ